MPGVGKTYILYKNQGIENATLQSIPLGKDPKKILNIINAVLGHPYVTFVVINLFIRHKLKYKNVLLRPYLVIIERLGRLDEVSKSVLILDEGVYQFVWRVFSEIPINVKTRKEMTILMRSLSDSSKNISYVHGNRKNYTSRVIQRNKVSSNFDKYLIEGKKEKVQLARSWMYLIIINLRSKMLIKEVIRNYE